jgi:processive 1,2-diacylglycerol beta-glucosyltransferase
MIRQIDASPEPFSLQVVAGRNEPFRAALERQRSSFRHKLTVLGYVDNMPERMLSAEVLVTKPGGMTSAEALALGVPMVLLPPLPGQELYNRDFLVGAGAALAAEDGGLCNLVTRLLTDPSRVAALRRRMAPLAHPRAADEIAAFVLNATALRAPDPATAGRS